MARHSRKYKVWYIFPVIIIFAVSITFGAFLGYRFINPDLGKKEEVSQEEIITSTAPPTVVPEEFDERQIISLCRVEHASGTDIFLRALPSEEGTIIDYIPDKTVLEVTEDNGDWTGVIYNGQHGYVKTRYIVPEETGIPTVRKNEY